MSRSREIDFKNDFKYITLFIGSNDACISCIAGDSFLSPNNFEKTMREVISEVQRRIPKVILNVHQQFNVSQVWDLTKDIPYCKNIRALGLSLECACAFQDSAEGARNRKTMDALTQEYNNRLLKIRDEYSKKQSDNFMLIVDPLFRDASIDDFPPSYISNVDCFHPGNMICFS
jgi:phospholipase B1